MFCNKEMRSWLSLFLICCFFTTQGLTCPENCTCSREKRSMKCSGKMAPPLTCPAYVQTLDLRGNKLRSLATDSFSGTPTVTYLVLNDNKIQDISTAAFRGLSRLKQINLKANQLRVLGAGMFQGVARNIKSIFLHENLINTIKDHAFDGLQKSTLNVLSLKHNNLTQIGRNNLVGLEKLKTLFLDFNQIETISAIALLTLKNLRKLSLENNKLKEFPSSVNLPKLQSLNLANNYIKIVSTNFFKYLKKLEVLNLSSNAIVKITDDALRNLQQLSALNLQGNKLKYLPDFLTNSKLKTLRLESNNWLCDCNMKDFRRWIDRVRVNITCFGPKQYHYTQLKSIAVEDLKCQKEDTNQQNTPTPETTLISPPTVPHLCPYVCDCAHGIGHVNCNNQEFSRVPSDLSESTVLLDLRKNRIRRMTRDSFKRTPNLISLHLQDNRMQQIENFAFRGLSNLIYLYLSQNEISVLGKEAFQGLKNLSYLFMDDNRLRHIPGDIFCHLPIVFAMYLRNNLIDELTARSLNGLRRLRWFYLENNRLSNLEPGTFSSCLRLERLDLSRNRLRSFSLDTVAGLHLLRSLDVSNNFLLTIFNPTPQKNFPIRSLKLARNNITEIDRKFFTSFPHLELFNVKGNSLRNLPALPQTLKEIDLSENLWECDCRLRPLLNFLRSSDIQQALTGLRCSRPPSYTGRDITGLSASALQCS